MLLPCPLCRSRAELFAVDRLRRYWRCSRCELVFADPASHLCPQAEKAVYDQHENSPDDAGYRRFLGRLADPLLQRLTQGMRGLDFGSGPGPTLSVMLQQAGMRMVIYDPCYAPDVSVLQQPYDFVTCSETAEHFCYPQQTWDQLTSLVQPGGWLAVMTSLLTKPAQFSDWYYKNDPTHVSFYAPGTLRWIARHHQMRIDLLTDHVILMQRPGKLEL